MVSTSKRNKKKENEAKWDKEGRRPALRQGSQARRLLSFHLSRALKEMREHLLSKSRAGGFRQKQVLRP